MKRFKQLGAIVAAVAAVAAAAVSAAGAASSHPNGGDGQSLTSLYKAALAEGGHLVVYAGGDVPGEWDATAAAFNKSFPGMHVQIATDLSKYHDARIDNQLARRNLEPDIALLQTTFDFDQWKRQGLLLDYKPIGFNEIFPGEKDPGGAWVGTSLLAFSNIVNTKLVPAGRQNLNYSDYLEPRYKGQISLTYPNDDDAVLFQWKLILDTYGWGYITKLLAQHPTFVRGTPASANPVLAGAKAVDLAGLLPLTGIPGAHARFALPRSDAFVSWAERAAIFKQAKHPAAAKLFESWMLSKPVQASLPAWPVREDVPPPAGYKPLSAYNTNPLAFPAFMANRAAVEAFRAQITLAIGSEPKGPDPAGSHGLSPYFS